MAQMTSRGMGLTNMLKRILEAVIFFLVLAWVVILIILALQHDKMQRPTGGPLRPHPTYSPASPAYRSVTIYCAIGATSSAGMAHPPPTTRTYPSVGG
jgi:hypothetical protein